MVATVLSVADRCRRFSIVTVVAVALIALALCLFSEWSAGLAEVERDDLGCLEAKPDIDELRDEIGYWDGYYNPHLIDIVRRQYNGFDINGLLAHVRDVEAMIPEMKWIVFQYELLCGE